METDLVDFGKAISILPLLASVGYFVYGGLDGVFAIVIFSILISATILLNLIPVLGFVIQVVLVLMWLSPMILNFTGISSSWLTSVIIGIVLFLSFIVNLLVTFVFALKKKLGWDF